jgi:hypothetical protein
MFEMNRIYPTNGNDTSDEMIETSTLENVCETCLHRKNGDCWKVESGYVSEISVLYGCSNYERGGD